jgi:long-subunit fatty acid transport protein
MFRRRLAPPLLSVVAASTAAPAFAGGLEVPDRGARALARGGAATAAIDDPTAVDLNPGALSRLRGGHVHYGQDLVWAHTRFTRGRTRIPQDANVTPVADPFAPVENGDALFPWGVTLAATHDLGLDGFTFALSVYGPHGSGSSSYPVDGGQRYMTTGYEGVILFPGVSVAYGTKNYGFGTTLQAATMPEMRYRLVVDGLQGGALNPLASSAEVEATVEASDPFAPTAIVGAWYRPSPEIEVAVSGRVVPVFFHAEGDLSLANVPGQSAFTPSQLALIGSGAQFDFTLPPTARLGVRYRGGVDDTPPGTAARETWDIEADVVYEAWSMFDQVRLDLRGDISLYGREPLPDVALDKRWRDTLSFRLGGDWHALPDTLTVSAGGFWERGAVPVNYENLDFPSFDRFGIGGGGRVDLPTFGGVSPTLAVAYQHVFQETRTVSETYGKVFQHRPLAPCPSDCEGRSGVPANAGRFESGFDQLALALTVAY